MSISLQKLNNGDYIRPKGKTWICPRCGNENVNQQISPKTRRIQKCSKCKLPKPMVFGVKVCTYCNSSDDVVFIPGFVHECPNCGSTQLKRFYPVTDEALKEGIHPKYASLKWQCECGHENPYPYANCLNCGASIDKALNKISADKNEPEERRNEIAQNMRLSNWLCPYCGRTNKGTEDVCPSCGNDRKRPEDDIIRQIRPELFSDEGSEFSKGSSPTHNQNAKQDSIHENPGRKKFEFNPDILAKGKSLWADMISIVPKVWWIFPVLIIILLIICNLNEEEFIISDMKYDTSYVIQKYTTTHHTGESNYPEGAYNIVEHQESRYVADEDDDDNWGYTREDDNDSNSDWSSSWDSDDDDDWGSEWGSSWDSDDDWGSDWGSSWDSDDDWGSDWGSDDWNDYGGDYFDSIFHVIQKLKKSFQTNAKKLLTKIEYYNVYDYDIDEWVYSRSVTYSGKKGEIKNQAPELKANERIGSSSTSYIIYLKKEGTENLYSLRINEQQWQKYQIGDTIKVKTLFGNPQFITE